MMQANSITDNLEKCTETFAGMTLAELMKDQLVKDECPVTGGVKNKLGDRIKKMTALEFHCYHNHIRFRSNDWQPIQPTAQPRTGAVAHEGLRLEAMRAALSILSKALPRRTRPLRGRGAALLQLSWRLLARLHG